jgi:hypothetical protein
MKVKKVKEEVVTPDEFEQEVMDVETPKQELPKAETPSVAVDVPKKKRGRPRKVQLETTPGVASVIPSLETAETILLEFQEKRKALKEQCESETKKLTDKYLCKIHKLMGI